MTEKKILIFFDSKNQLDVENFEFLLKNIDLNKYKIDLIIEETIKIKLSKKINIIKFKQTKNIFYKYLLKSKLKNKYDLSILYTIDSLFGNYIIRKKSKNSVIVANLIDKEFKTSEEYRKYFINRNIYEFNHIIFKNYQEQEKFIKFYPTLSKKTDVINNLINYEKIEKLSQEHIPEKIKRTDMNLLLIEELNEGKNKISEKLKLIKDLKNDIPNIKLYIIGDGIDKYAYETYIEDNNLKDTIYLLGNKKNVCPYIKKCKYVFLFNKKSFDKYIFPSILLKTKVITICRYSDDTLKSEKHFYIISNILQTQKKEINNILKNKEIKNVKLELDQINKNKIIKLLI